MPKTQSQNPSTRKCQRCGQRHPAAEMAYRCVNHVHNLGDFFPADLSGCLYRWLCFDCRTLPLPFYRAS